ncbi:tyrosine-type recombinase/integrase [Psychromonas sp. PT13]|uniref:tyrosine-type recombinase/integrase n=1 Tax=Psychromonas sp. PT13 TaxID=3439547 RepID=UPI003EBD8E47
MILKNLIQTKRIVKIGSFQLQELVLTLKSDFSEVKAFSLFQRRLRTGDSRNSNEPVAQNTFSSYQTAVAKFLDYLAEAGVLGSKNALRPQDLIEIIRAYEEYLVLGDNSKNKIASDLAKQLDNYKPKISNASTPNHIAPINEFLEMSEEISRAENTKFCRENGIENPDSQYIPLLKEVWDHKTISKKQKENWQKNTLLGGVIRDAGCLRLKDTRIIKSTKDYQLQEKPYALSYPISHVLKQLKKGKLSKRNKCLFALLHSGGLRISEALSLQWHHIDLVNRQIFLTEIDPKGLSKEEFHYSVHNKGRLTPNNEVFLYTDAEQVFWESLRDYMKSTEYCPDGTHDFVFVLQKGKRKGRPCILLLDTEHRNVSTLNKAFKKASKNAGVPNYNDLPIHSTRHGYCTYLANDAPYINDEGKLVFGLPEVFVQRAVGHGSILTTRAYIRSPEDKIVENHHEARIKLRLGGYADSDMALLRQLEYHKKALRKTEEEIKKSQQAKGISHV